MKFRSSNCLLELPLSFLEIRVEIHWLEKFIPSLQVKYLFTSWMWYNVSQQGRDWKPYLSPLKRLGQVHSVTMVSLKLSNRKCSCEGKIERVPFWGKVISFYPDYLVPNRQHRFRFSSVEYRLRTMGDELSPARGWVWRQLSSPALEGSPCTWVRVWPLQQQATTILKCWLLWD